MKLFFATLLLIVTMGAQAVSFEKIDAAQLNSSTLKDFYPQIESLMEISPIKNKYQLFLRTAQLVNVDQESDAIAALVAWPFNWMIEADMVIVQKVYRKGTLDVFKDSLQADSFFVKGQFKNNLKSFAAFVELKFERNDSLRLYQVGFDEEMSAFGFVLINSKSEEAILFLAIED